MLSPPLISRRACLTPSRAVHERKEHVSGVVVALGVAKLAPCCCIGAAASGLVTRNGPRQANAAVADDLHSAYRRRCRYKEPQ